MLPTILLVGLNHTTAPVSVREHAARFACGCDPAPAKLQPAFDPALFHEHLFLTTCNRTEVYAVTSDPTRAANELRLAFSIPDAPMPNHAYLYEYVDRQAVAHLFAVASGIDSLVLGEFEILGQVRRAYQHAAAQHTLGPVLHYLFQSAVRVGKRARAETDIGTGALSIAYAAVALAQQHIGALTNLTALVIGAGEMARRAAENLREDGGCEIVVTSRTYDHALKLARRVSGQAVPFSQLDYALTQADLVISATRAPHLILSAAALAAVMRARPTRPLCLIDIAVPRDIDPAAAALDNVQLFNIDDLSHVIAHTRAARSQALAQVQAIIAEQVEAFWQWHLTRGAAPLISELYARADAIRQAELNKTLRRLRHLPLTQREHEILDALSTSLVNKILAAPTVNLQARLREGDGQLYLDALRDLFDLQTGTGAKSS